MPSLFACRIKDKQLSAIVVGECVRDAGWLALQWQGVGFGASQTEFDQHKLDGVGNSCDFGWRRDCEAAQPRLGPVLGLAEIDAEVDKLRIRALTASANRDL